MFAHADLKGEAIEATLPPRKTEMSWKSIKGGEGIFLFECSVVNRTLRLLFFGLRPAFPLMRWGAADDCRQQGHTPAPMSSQSERIRAVLARSEAPGPTARLLRPPLR